jgi:formylmethanofuran dehydrogenase subunit E
MFNIPDWAYEFHGHKCPFMPIGYRMGDLAMRKLGVGRTLNHEMFVFSEMGVGHPQGCMQDGIQSATAATFGKGQMQKLYYGKVAANFYYPGKSAVRISLKNEFVDKLSPHEFFKYRKKGVEPSEIPQDVSEDIINLVLNADDDELFNIKMLPDFKYTPPESSFNKDKCDVCGEYVFEHYLRRANGINICIPCSGYEDKENVIRPNINTGE